jgi:hypothetical protein
MRTAPESVAASKWVLTQGTIAGANSSSPSLASLRGIEQAGQWSQTLTQK